MSLRPLLIDDAARAQVTKVVSYAMDHPWHPSESVPGDNPNHVAVLNTYRCVFTFTHVSDRVFRHLSISVPQPGKFANPAAAFHIAELFGFTGYDVREAFIPAPDWIIDTKLEENCIIIAQEI
jgi:hypothetical protein